MKNGKKVLHFIAVTMLVIFIVLGFGSTCSSAPAAKAGDLIASAEITGVPWAEYTHLPSKDYTVIGAAVLRDVNRKTFIYDLMAKVVEMGGHDVINVRMAVTPDGEITNVTAVVIRYTAETINPSKDGILVSDLADINFLQMGYGDLPSKKPDEIVRAPWTGQNTVLPFKDYVVVGLINLKETNSRTVLADLMDKAIELGGHDIMNVRLTIISNEVVRERVSANNSQVSNPQTTNNSQVSNPQTTNFSQAENRQTTNFSQADNRQSTASNQQHIAFNREIDSAFALAIKYTNENIKIITDIKPVSGNTTSANANMIRQLLPGR